MKAIYIFVLLFSMLGLHMQAQSIELGGILPASDGSLNGRMIIVKINNGDKQIKALQLESFSLRNGMSNVTSENIPLGDGYYLLPIPTTLNRDFEVPLITTSDRYAYRAKLTTTDGITLTTEMVEDNGVERFKWIGSDIKWTSFTQGEIGPKVDLALGGFNPFAVSKINFYKSFSVHGKGSFTFDFPADNQYTRMFTYYGIQDDRPGGDVRFSFVVDGTTIETHDMYSMSNPVKPENGIYLRKFETPIKGKTNIQLLGDVIDDAAYDHMNFPMGRIYLKTDTRKSQNASWKSIDTLAADKPFTQTIDAAFTSGGKAFYQIVSGNEYASIEGNILNVHSIPTDKSAFIEIKAIQLGTADYMPARPSICRFYIRNNKTVPRDGKLILNNRDEVDQLTVYADPESCGQVVVDNGFAIVKKLILKYTFTPGKWNFISFPANVSLSQISDLNQLGYKFNDQQKAFYVCEYNTRSRAEYPEKTAWTRLTTDNVIKNKGYIMGISRSADNPNNTPIEVTFVFENTTLGIDQSNNGSLNVELNMMQVEPDTEIPVYIMPDDGIKGVPLKVMVRFSPKDISVLPINYANALNDTRITFTPNNAGIRLTLPTQEQAKVVIFDNKNHIVKAVKYIAPYMIDIHDLKSGKYQIYIQYGDSETIKQFGIKDKS